MLYSSLENRTEQCGKILKRDLSAENISEGSCFDFICTLPNARKILLLGIPNKCNWNTEVLGSPIWEGFLHLSSALFALLFLSFAIVCIFLLVRRHKIDRFMIKTTLAVLITLSILGFSRAALSIMMSVALGGKVRRSFWGPGAFGLLDNNAFYRRSRISKPHSQLHAGISNPSVGLKDQNRTRMLAKTEAFNPPLFGTLRCRHSVRNSRAGVPRTCLHISCGLRGILHSLGDICLCHLHGDWYSPDQADSTCY